MKYYSCLAQLLHTWRDNAAAIFEHWKRIFGPESAMSNSAHVVPPRPITGRWGQKSLCERFILSKEVDKAIQIFTDVVTRRTYFLDANDPQPKRKRRRKGNIDETQADTSAAFSSTMGRWSTTAVNSIQDMRFWLGLRVSAKLSSRLDRMLATLMKYSKLDRDSESDFGSLATFVFEKSDAVFQGLLELTSGHTWRDVTDWCSEVLYPTFDADVDTVWGLLHLGPNIQTLASQVAPTRLQKYSNTVGCPGKLS